MPNYLKDLGYDALEYPRTVEKEVPAAQVLER